MLRVIQTGPERRGPRPLFDRTAEPVEMLGFHGVERDDVREFRWLGETARLRFAPASAGRFLELPVFSEYLDLSQELAVEVAGETAAHCLLNGWTVLSLAIPPAASEVTLESNEILPPAFHPGDARTLALRVGVPRLHGDAERHRVVKAVWDNRILNWREMSARATELRSTPPNLGVDLHGVCNVKPPCVYCDWDAFKAQEGDFVDEPFTRQTLESWGPFYEQAESLINCGIGEPFMMKNLDELLDVFDQGDKMLEVATNGQILTDRNIERLVGRKVRLFVSLDAATPETYAKLRNDTLPKILDNLRRLISAKGGRGGFPKVFLVFMPMRVNAHELEAFVELCAELDVDEMVLRPLNYSDELGLDWERAGYHFVYEEELLPFDELVRISGRAAELCRRHAVTLSDKLDFGDATMEDSFPEEFSDGRREIEPEPVAASTTAPPPVEAVPLEAPDMPMCHEPWKHLYILRRGVYPCCYGHSPLAPMDHWEEVWNSPRLQEIRGELAAGRLHDYCLESTSCPIVQKHLHGGRMPLRQALPLRLERWLHRLDRGIFGSSGKLYPAVRWVLPRLGRALRDPRYLPRHLVRLWRERGSAA